MDTFENTIHHEYFEWLYKRVCKGRVNRNVSYKKIFAFLYDTEFIFSIRDDGNRAQDGIDLRYRFAMTVDKKYPVREIMDILGGPCTVLEMMIALAVICEESIMDNTDYGDRTGQWFWEMMNNLGISHMTDDNFDYDEAKSIIDTFLERRYQPDGQGGLFYIRGCKDDLRDIEIWTQLCWYLDYFV